MAYWYGTCYAPTVASVEIAASGTRPRFPAFDQCSSRILRSNRMTRRSAGPKSIRVVERLRDENIDYLGGIK